MTFLRCLVPIVLGESQRGVVRQIIGDNSLLSCLVSLYGGMAGHPARRDPITLVNIVELLIYDPDGVVYNKMVDRVVVLHVGVNRKIHSRNGSKNDMGVNEALVVGQFKPQSINRI